MSFVYPGFLWALGALAIPLVIHLFNFRRTTRVIFSTTRYLRQIKEVSTAKRRLKHWLVLFARLLFITFLVFAFAQPFLPATQQEGLRRHVVFYLDNSQSMSAQMDESTRAMDEGISYIQEILKAMPAETRFRLVTNDFAPSSNTFKTRGEIEDLLTQLRLSPISRQAEEVRNRIVQGVESLADLEVFWLSDFQRSTFGTPSRPDSLIAFRLVPIQSELYDNVYIDSVFLANPFSIGSEQSQVSVQVHNDGSKDINTLNVRLAVNGIQTSTTAVELPAGSSAVATLDINSRLHGMNEAQVSFTDFPISFDNDYYFTLNYNQRIQVLELKSKAGSTPVQQVYGNEELFSYHGYGADNFNYSLLNTADLVVLNGLDKFPSGLLPALTDYLGKGGTIFLIPGANPDVAAYRELTALNLSQVSDSPLQELSAPPASHPFFSDVFEESSASVLMPQATKVLDWGMDRSALLKFKNDQPFLSYFQRVGRVYVLASPLQEPYTNLATNALFVPIMYKVAANSRKETSRLYYSLNEPFIEQPMDSLNPDIPLRFSGDIEVVPTQRIVNGRVYFDLPKFMLSPGFYHVLAEHDTVNLVAFDLSKEESRMARIPEAELVALFGNTNATLLQTGSIESFGNEIKARYLGRPLWKYALALALLFLLAEVLLIRFMK